MARRATKWDAVESRIDWDGRDPMHRNENASSQGVIIVDDDCCYIDSTHQGRKSV